MWAKGLSFEDKNQVLMTYNVLLWFLNRILCSWWFTARLQQWEDDRLAMIYQSKNLKYMYNSFELPFIIGMKLFTNPRLNLLKNVCSFLKFIDHVIISWLKIFPSFSQSDRHQKKIDRQLPAHVEYILRRQEVFRSSVFWPEKCVQCQGCI